MGDLSSLIQLILKTTMLGSLVYLIYLGLPLQMPREVEPEFSTEFSQVANDVAKSQPSQSLTAKVDRALRAPASIVDRMIGTKLSKEASERVLEQGDEGKGRVANKSNVLNKKKKSKDKSGNESEGELLKEEEEAMKAIAEASIKRLNLRDVEKSSLTDNISRIAPNQNNNLPPQATKVSESTESVQPTTGVVATAPLCPTPSVTSIPDEGIFSAPIEAKLSLNVSGAIYYCLVKEKDKDGCNYTTNTLPCDPLPTADGILYTGNVTISENTDSTTKKGWCMVYTAYGCGKWTAKKTALFYVDPKVPSLIVQAPRQYIQTRELWDPANHISYTSNDFSTTQPQRMDIFSYLVNYSANPFPTYNIWQILEATSPEDEGLVQYHSLMSPDEFTRSLFTLIPSATHVTIPFKFPDGKENGLGYGDNYIVLMAINSKMKDTTAKVAYQPVQVKLEDFEVQGFSVGGGSYTPNANGVNVIEAEFASFGNFDSAVPGEEGRSPASAAVGEPILESDFINMIN